MPGHWAIVAGVAALIVLADIILEPGPVSARIVAWDARVYWDALALDDPYAGARLGVLGSFLYSPAFLVLLAPLQVAGWHGFLFALTAAGAGVGLWMIEAADPRLRRWWPVLGALAVIDLWAGNVHLLLAASIVVSLQSAPGWSFAVLTKVTPAVGALWHAFRREWGATGATVVSALVVVAITLPAGVELWPAWLEMLTSQDQPFAFVILPAPLPLRLAIAMVVIAWAARTGRRWVVPAACMFALPAIWPISLAMLLGSAALWQPALAPVRVRTAPIARTERARRRRGGTVAT